MNQEEFIDKLQMVYVGDRNALNEIVKEHEDLVSYACDLEDEICNLKGENQRLNNILNELEKIIQTCIYGIEPEGCSINFNCEYDSEEDYISGMQTQARLNTYKFVLKQLKELKESDNHGN